MLKEIFPNIAEDDLKNALQDNMLDVEETIAELLQKTPGKNIDQCSKQLTNNGCLNLIVAVKL